MFIKYQHDIINSKYVDRYYMRRVTPYTSEDFWQVCARMQSGQEVILFSGDSFEDASDAFDYLYVRLSNHRTTTDMDSFYEALLADKYESEGALEEFKRKGENL